ncbi:MAG: TonB family protein [Pyrinomonadaceae bacterium]
MKGKSFSSHHQLSYRNLLRLILVLVFVPLAPAWAYGQSAEEPAKADAAAATVQARIERARALAAAHQLEAAVRELESVRSAAKEDVVRNVASVMLMSIYLEEGNYARAESLLEETFRTRSAQTGGSIRTYFALAGQAVNGARAHLARYRSFGINVSDSALPPEALNDLDRLRSLLERMIAQAKEITKDTSKAYDSLALLEDVLGIRLSLARDGEDREKWEKEYAGARQGLVSSQTEMASLDGIPTLQSQVGRATSPADAPSSVGNSKTETLKPDISQHSDASDRNGGAAEPNNSVDSDTLSIGSLNHWATKKVVPVYPQAAKAAGATGVVRVYLTTDEDGRVANISHSEGPVLLRKAAEDTARLWRFQPTVVAGKRFRLTGYIEFTFTL